MRTRTSAIACALLAVATVGTSHIESQNSATARSQPRLTLQRLVDPATRVEVDGRVVSFALLGLIRFETVVDLFQHIDRETGRWRFATSAERQAFGDDLLRRGVESRIVSMETELPLEILLTHTQAEIERAVAAVRTSDAPAVFRGRHWQVSVEAYRDAFVRVRDRWQKSLNCWSRAPSIPGRVLSNWYLIDEGIELYGAVYDSTEHFWQAVKYHPDVTLREVRELIAAFKAVDWRAWVAALENDQRFYFEHAYAVEFLEFNLRPEQFDRFDRELAAAGAPEERARTMQQRGGRETGRPVRFTSLQEKVLWGDLADVFHLVFVFSEQGRAPLPPGADRVRAALSAQHFDDIYLPGHAAGRFPFLSPVFQELMLEIWKVKYLQIPRFGEVIRATAGRRLDHFLNDGDSPDIPIRVYVGQLNRIRDLALAQVKAP
jgi:hypothetical protein